MIRHKYNVHDSRVFCIILRTSARRVSPYPFGLIYQPASYSTREAIVKQNDKWWYINRWSFNHKTQRNRIHVYWISLRMITETNLWEHYIFVDIYNWDMHCSVVWKSYLWLYNITLYSPSVHARKSALFIVKGIQAGVIGLAWSWDEIMT